MYPRIVRQIEFIGSVGALGTAGLAFARSKSIELLLLLATTRSPSNPLEFPGHNTISADVVAHSLRN